jgi:hypothetical protein
LVEKTTAIKRSKVNWRMKMIMFEKIVGEIKQLPREDKRRLLEILQNEVTVAQSERHQNAVQEASNFSEALDLASVDPELMWLMQNDSVLRKYRGEYIALKGGELIAHGTLGEVLAESKRRGIDQPFTQYIPKTEKEWLLGQGNYPITSPPA